MARGHCANLRRPPAGKGGRVVPGVAYSAGRAEPDGGPPNGDSPSVAASTASAEAAMSTPDAKAATYGLSRGLGLLERPKTDNPAADTAATVIATGWGVPVPAAPAAASAALAKRTPKEAPSPPSSLSSESTVVAPADARASAEPSSGDEPRLKS
jgi:hypothetical protein